METTAALTSCAGHPNEAHDWTDECCMGCSNTSKSLLLHFYQRHQQYISEPDLSEMIDGVAQMTEEEARTKYQRVVNSKFAQSVNVLKIASGMMAITYEN